MKDFVFLINVGKRAQVSKPNCLRRHFPGKLHFGQEGVEIWGGEVARIICRFAAVAVCERVKSESFTVLDPLSTFTLSLSIVEL